MVLTDSKGKYRRISTRTNISGFGTPCSWRKIELGKAGKGRKVKS